MTTHLTQYLIRNILTDQSKFQPLLLAAWFPKSEWFSSIHMFPTKPVPLFFLINCVLIACALHQSAIHSFPNLFQITELEKDCIASAGVVLPGKDVHSLYFIT